jgi:hypothetical protein
MLTFILGAYVATMYLAVFIVLGPGLMVKDKWAWFVFLFAPITAPLFLLWLLITG